MVRLHSEFPPQTTSSLCSALVLRNAPVRDRRGRRIGRIRDVVLFAQHGMVSYAVVGFGGVFGLGEQRVAIPWSRLRIATTGRCVMLDDDRQLLKRAPTVAAQSLHNFATPESHAMFYRLHAHVPGPDNHTRGAQLSS